IAQRSWQWLTKELFEQLPSILPLSWVVLCDIDVFARIDLQIKKKLFCIGYFEVHKIVSLCIANRCIATPAYDDILPLRSISTLDPLPGISSCHWAMGYTKQCQSCRNKVMILDQGATFTTL